MLLVTDIGNTNITMGVYDGDKLAFTVRLATDVRRTADQYALEIRDILDINGFDYRSISAAAVCSVVPTVQSALVAALKKLCGIDAFVLAPGVKTGLNIKIDDPAQLGADLAAGAVGVIGKYKLPAVIIDMGTATTVSVVGKNREFLGGAIAAGLKLSLNALTGNTAQLPMIDLKTPSSVIGTNTVDCMCSGVVIGAAAMIDGMIDRINAEMGEECTAVATGGLACEVIKNCRHKIVADDDLLLNGMKIIYEKNRHS